jgi:hypothetical protein
MEYQPLDPDKHEIRVVRILPITYHHDLPDELHCEIKTVPLRTDHTRFYESFLDEMRSDGSTREQARATWKRLREEFQTQGTTWNEVINEAEARTRLSLRNAIPPPSRYDWGDYVTLSYTWGDRRLKEEICVYGQKVAVSLNLFQALKCLRDNVLHFDDNLYIWADALCINQQDTDERNVQVGRIGEIYERSVCTYSFLAGNGIEASVAEEFLTAIAQQHGKDVEETFGFLNSFDVRDSNNARKWRALNEVLAHAYWTRLWIVQELILSHPLVELRFGNSRLAYSDLEKVIDIIRLCPLLAKQFIESSYRHLNLPLPLQSIEVYIARIIRLHAAARLVLEMGTKEGKDYLSTVLALSHNSLQTNVKDKVYGILGIVSIDIAERIEPEYNLSLEEILIQFTTSVILSTRSLDVLRLRASFAPIRAYERKVPSWVLDFAHEASSDAQVPLRKYSATNGLPAGLIFSPDNRSLSCAGFILDRIDGLSCSISDMKFSSDIVQPTHNISIYGSDAASAEALWRTLVANCGPDGRAPAPPSWHTLLRLMPERHRLQEILRPQQMHNEAWKWLEAFRHDNRKLELLGSNLTCWFMSWWGDLDEARAALTEEEIAGIGDMIQPFMWITGSRRLITTEKGWVGLSAIPARQGDAVAILMGSDAPVVLRPVEDYYEVVGECYIHGVMDGEAVEGLATGQFEITSLTLR